jgi:aarF domain-containing kinase
MQKILGKKEFGEWLKVELTALGPVFVKLGQLISTRSDWLDPEVRKELANLQDNVDDYSPVSFTHPNITELNGMPLASASFGQVHDCKWNGTPAVLKVQKPTVRTSLASDMWGLALLLCRLDKLGVASAQHILEIVRDYRHSLWKELNYDSEANNLKLLTGSLDNLKWNKVPHVYYASRNSIVMEKVNGIKITDIDKLNANNIERQKVVRALLKSFFYQVLVGGVFHADPHPGNIAVTKNGLVWYDGGAVCVTGPEWRQEILVLTRSVLKKDENDIMNNLVTMKIVKSDPVSVAAVRSLVRSIIKMINNTQLKQNWRQLLVDMMMDDPKYSNDLRNAMISSSSYVMLGRALTLIEGICEILDPSFDLVNVGLPIIQDLWITYIPFSEYSSLITEMYL